MNENINIDNENFCKDAQLLIDDYLDGMTSLQDKTLIDNHISKCNKCSDYLKETSAIIKKINSLPKEVEQLSLQKKNQLWNNIEEKIYSNDGINIPKSKISKYKYIISSVAACIIITLVIFAVKNLNFSDIQISKTNVIGLPTYWKVSNIQGTPMINDVAMNNIDSIQEGQWITTGSSSKAELIISSIGKVIIEPNSMIRFVKGSAENNRIAVEYGTIDANMISTAKTFFVEMPSAVAMDLGGAYRLTIDSTGDGLVYVKSGKVEIQSPNRDAIVPAGNLVMTKRDMGVGTPFNENSSPIFKNALFNLDFKQCGSACVNTLLRNARITDAITLINLIPKVDAEYKDELYTKAANFVPPPPGNRADSIPFLDDKKLNEWIEKIQEEVQKNVEESIRNMEESLEHIKEMEKFKFDNEKWAKEWSKDWKFNAPHLPEGENSMLEWNGDSVYFDKEQFKKDMDEMKKELKEDLDFNNEEFKRDMEELKEDLKEMNEDLKDLNKNLKEDFNFNSEEFKKEMEKVKEEIQKSIQDVKKNTKMKIKKDKDSIYKFEDEGDDNEDDNEDDNIKSVPEVPPLKPEEEK